MSQLKVNSVVPLAGLPGFTGTTQAGGVIQVVQKIKTDTFSGTSDDTEIAITGMTLTITPASTSSKIMLLVSLFYGCNGTTYSFYPKRGNTIVGVGDSSGSRQQHQGALGHTHDNNQCDQCTTIWMDSPNTTSATTYSLYLRNDNNVAFYLNRSTLDQNNDVGKRGISTITAMELG